MCALRPISLDALHRRGRTRACRARAAAARRDGALGACVETWRLDFSALRRAGPLRRARRRVSRRRRCASRADVYRGLADTLMTLHAPAALGLQSLPPRLGAQAATGSSSIIRRARRVHHRERRLGRRRRLPAVRHDVGDRDLPPARRISRRSRARSPMRTTRAGWPAATASPTCSTRRATASSGCRACIPTTARCSTSSATIAITPTSISSRPTARTTAGARGRSVRCIRAPGKPQGLFDAKNRATGYASTAGKMARGVRARRARCSPTRDRAFADTLRHKAIAAYALGRGIPASCQTAPAVAVLLRRRQLGRRHGARRGAAPSTHRRRSAICATRCATRAQEPVTPWMGADTARHYSGIRGTTPGTTSVDARRRRATCELARYYREGLERVARRATNGFRVGIPFIWCSNDLMVSFATQARLLPPHDGRRALSRIRAGGDRLAVRRESVGHVDVGADGEGLPAGSVRSHKAKRSSRKNAHPVAARKARARRRCIRH